MGYSDDQSKSGFAQSLGGSNRRGVDQRLIYATISTDSHSPAFDGTKVTV